MRVAPLLTLLVATSSCGSVEVQAGGGGAAGSGGTGGAHAGSQPTGGSSGSGSTDSGILDARAEETADAFRCEEPPFIAPAPAGLELDPIEGQAPLSFWWVVTSAGRNEASSPMFAPPASPPAPTPSTADGRTFVHMTGSGLGTIDYGELVYAPQPSINGGEPTDLSDGGGITFDARGTVLWLDVHTIDTDPRFCKCSGTDCYAGYRYRLPLSSNWTTYTVTWDKLELPSYVVNRPPLSIWRILAIGIGGLGEDFDVSIDNFALAPRNVDAGTPRDSSYDR
jgi:hypothetical protein